MDQMGEVRSRVARLRCRGADTRFEVLAWGRTTVFKLGDEMRAKFVDETCNLRCKDRGRCSR
jgi:hypothetical protein